MTPNQYRDGEAPSRILQRVRNKAYIALSLKDCRFVRVLQTLGLSVTSEEPERPDGLRWFLVRGQVARHGYHATTHTGYSTQVLQSNNFIMGVQ
jgi:hypothetical protein